MNMIKNTEHGIKLKPTAALLVSLLLVACSGGGGGDSKPGVTPTPGPLLTGVLTDAVVSGVFYQTETQSGLTNDNGQYNYEAGETVTFSIGDTRLGTVVAGPVITPLTLAGATDVTDQQVTNIVRLLMTLDVDGNPDNGITITENTRDAANGVTIDFNVPTMDFTNDPEVTALIAGAETSRTALVDSGVAQLHLANTLASTWGLMQWGTGQWSSN